MELSIYNTVGIVFNPFDNYNQKVGTVFKVTSPKFSGKFTYVGAVGKVKVTQRIEKLNSFFMGC